MMEVVVNYIYEHKDLWFGYWYSLIQGIFGGVIHWLAADDTARILGNLAILASFVLTVILSIKAIYGIRKSKLEIDKLKRKDD